MPDTSERDQARRSKQANTKNEDPSVEEEAAVERGERIDTGKAIARGGKEDGHVPGATEQTPVKGE